jgi:hypothetical protein
MDKINMRGKWYLGFFGFFAFFAVPGIIKGDYLWIIWLVWGGWFIYLIPLKKGEEK